MTVIIYNQTLVTIGAQWGDEGKGKIVDSLCATGNFDWVVRFNGGANAGHSVYVGDQKYTFHQVPSGMINPNTKGAITNGCVVDIPRLLQEIQELDKIGLSVVGRFFVSSEAHIVTPKHLQKDKVNQKKFGSTGRGIGPAYTDKVARSGVQIGTLYSMSDKELTKLVGADNLDQWKEHIDTLRPYVADTFWILSVAYMDGNKILFEGAQGALLDLDHGTYPDVTSSNVVSSYAAVGSGLPPQAIRKVLGVAKGYTTRVGTGPFPTEMDSEIAETFRNHTKDFGATTGRPRRMGWLDLPLLSRCVVQNGISELALTRMDSLNIFTEIPVCTQYANGKHHHETLANYLRGVQPVYTTMAGWPEYEFTGVTKYTDLPVAVRNYIDLIESYCKVRVKYIGVGPSRENLITL